MITTAIPDEVGVFDHESQLEEQRKDGKTYFLKIPILREEVEAFVRYLQVRRV